MALIEFKDLPNTTTPITADNLNNNFDELNKLNSLPGYVQLSEVSVTQTDTAQTVGTYTITEDGLYLIVGFALPNLYGQSGREMYISFIKNNQTLVVFKNVINTDAYTITVPLNGMFYFQTNDVIEIKVSNSVNGKNWSFEGGSINILKLR